MADADALHELRQICSNFAERLKQARAAHDDYMIAILGRRVSALDAGIRALEKQAHTTHQHSNQTGAPK